jgi:hypothetical protein
MAEEPLPDYFRAGHHFDPMPLTLDLYRLLCMVLGDQRVAAFATEHSPIQRLQYYRKGEVLRILTSSAVALRILLDQHSKQFKSSAKSRCGDLWPKWPKQKTKPEPLTLREACNKIIHASKIHDDLVIPDRHHNPDEEGSYIRPFLYLYGTKEGTEWRAKLSIVDFVRSGAGVFLYFMQ